MSRIELIGAVCIIDPDVSKRHELLYLILSSTSIKQNTKIELLFITTVVPFYPPCYFDNLNDMNEHPLLRLTKRPCFLPCSIITIYDSDEVTRQGPGKLEWIMNDFSKEQGLNHFYTHNITVIPFLTDSETYSTIHCTLLAQLFCDETSHSTRSYFLCSAGFCQPHSHQYCAF